MPTICDQAGAWQDHVGDATIRGWLHADGPDNAQLNAALQRDMQDDAGLSMSDFAVLGHLTDEPDGRVRGRLRCRRSTGEPDQDILCEVVSTSRGEDLRAGSRSSRIGRAAAHLYEVEDEPPGAFPPVLAEAIE